MSDFALDPVTGDLAISAGRLQVIKGTDAFGQRLKIRLRLFKGDWFLNQLEGVPYHDHVLPKRVSPGVRREVFRRVIASMRGTKQVLAIELEIDPRSRQLSLSGAVQLEDLTTVAFALDPPAFDFGPAVIEGEGTSA